MKKIIKLIAKPFVIFYYMILRIIKGIEFYFYKRSIIKNGREKVFSESSKAKSRREREGFFEKYCKGEGLDIGFGGDLIHESAFGFDVEHGDATYLKMFKDKKFDYIYSSHLVEHLAKPELALRNWWKLLKEGGYLITYLPHRDLYEKKKNLPSNFNKDHKFFYLLGEEDLPDTKDILKVIDESVTDYELVYAKVCDENYSSSGNEQSSTGEYSIEIVIQKKK